MSIPWEIADAVELWARQRGRHARMEWNRLLGCPVIHFTLRGDDPRLEPYQMGEIAEEPTESIALHEWDDRKQRYVPLDLSQYGKSGVVELLEKADTWSGRGEYDTFAEAVAAGMNRNKRHREALIDMAANNAAEWAHERRRAVLGIPLVPVSRNIEPE